MSVHLEFSRKFLQYRFCFLADVQRRQNLIGQSQNSQPKFVPLGLGISLEISKLVKGINNRVGASRFGPQALGYLRKAQPLFNPIEKLKHLEGFSQRSVYVPLLQHV